MTANAIARYPFTTTSNVVVTTGTANTSRVNPPTASSVVDGPVAGADGAIVKMVSAVATVATIQGLFQVWEKSAGGTYFLIGEVLTATATPSTTVAGASLTWVPPAGERKLAAGARLAYTVSKAEVWAVMTDQQDY